jgi:hypothetical protein
LIEFYTFYNLGFLLIIDWFDCLINSDQTNEITDDKRDCRGLCLSSQIDSYHYQLDECGHCLLENTSLDLNNCSLECNTNDRVKHVCDHCIDINKNDSLSELLNTCGRCRANDITGCSCDKYVFNTWITFFFLNILPNEIVSQI